MEITSMTNMFYFVVNTANKIQRTIDIVLLKKNRPNVTRRHYPGVQQGFWSGFGNLDQINPISNRFLHQ